MGRGRRLSERAEQRDLLTSNVVGRLAVGGQDGALPGNVEKASKVRDEALGSWSSTYTLDMLRIGDEENARAEKLMVE